MRFERMLKFVKDGYSLESEMSRSSLLISNFDSFKPELILTAFKGALTDGWMTEGLLEFDCCCLFLA